MGRFPGPEHLASYAGMVPRVHSSREDPLRADQDVNQYLKWAYTEAGNVVARYHKIHPHRHVSVLYARIRRRKGHQVAVGAVGRHLAEATYWMLKKGEPYQDPRLGANKAGCERGKVMDQGNPNF